MLQVATRQKQAGFTLAEVLAALVFMAIVIPVALEGLSIASKAGEIAARKSEAALVAERVLNESVVTSEWSSGVQNGTVHMGLREYPWTLDTQVWTEDAFATDIRLLSVQVQFMAQGRPYSVRLSTLVDDSQSQTNSIP